MAGRMSADEAAGLFVHVAIARRGLVAERQQRPVVHLVGVVRIGGMKLRTDVGRMVVEQVEHVVTFALCRSKRRVSCALTIRTIHQGSVM